MFDVWILDSWVTSEIFGEKVAHVFVIMFTEFEARSFVFEYTYANLFNYFENSLSINHDGIIKIALDLKLCYNATL